ncbi:MAG: hypothetical protein Q9213_000640 [Squamulea squamosa]
MSVLVPVVASVGAITSAYREGAELVAQIRGKRGARGSPQNSTLQEVTSQELQASLNRGAEAVESQFDRDATRFGEQYTTGVACESLKNVIIELQSRMVVDLKLHLYQETTSDFPAIQDIVDTSQDRVVLILLQLQQRVIMAGSTKDMSHLPSFWDRKAPSGKDETDITISDTNTTAVTFPMLSSTDSRRSPTPEHDNNMRVLCDTAFHGAARRQLNTPECNDMTSENQKLSHEGLSTMPVHRILPPPTHSNELGNGPEETSSSTGTGIFGSFGRNCQDFSTAVGGATRAPSSSVVPQYLVPAIQGTPSSDSLSTQRPLSQRFSSRASKSLQDTQTRPKDHPPIFGAGQAENHPWGTPHSSLPSDTNQDTQSFISSHTSRTSQETHNSRSFQPPVAPSTITVITAKKDSISAKDLLPSEANKYSGFCKGAWRLQIGDYKKALQERQRPGSMYKAVRFWQCTHCKFEGRLVQLEKKTKDFDQQVMLADGIQFRWVFLFKSHVERKDANPNPLRSTFGCIFCCAEGRGTPTFNGAQALMDHLQEHRVRVPVGEVLYRMNAIVGEKMPMEADFDVNLVAKEGLTI